LLKNTRIIYIRICSKTFWQSACFLIKIIANSPNPIKEHIMKWTDTQRIAEELYDLHGDSIDPKTVRFTQLRDLIMALPEFDDDPARCGERILEAVQQAWIDEAE
jgi:feS assembly protein iscX